MNKKFVMLFITILFITNSSYAGFNGTTHHSRANCGNNETISWDLMSPQWFFMTSNHINTVTGDTVHYLVKDLEYTRRSAIIDWGEGTSGWAVHGMHWMYDKESLPYLAHEEYVTDCSIYDGWWQN